MKILIITQAIDSENTTLGFFISWIKEFSKKSEKINVICLYKGVNNLDENIGVYSLGKKKGASKIKYIKNFYKHIWNIRKDYDIVFVHMNQEYVLLCGIFWKIFGKKILFWRNHPYGNILTTISVWLSDVVFATAKDAFVMKFKKTKLMPAGIQTSIFQILDTNRIKTSLLVFGRIAPVKNIDLVLDLFEYAVSKGLNLTLDIVGDYIERDKKYFDNIKKRVEESKVSQFIQIKSGVGFKDAPKVYQSHEILLNFTKSGSFDKTVIEALACGSKVLVSNKSMENILPNGSYTEGSLGESFNMLNNLLNLSDEEVIKYRKESEDVVKSQSIEKLFEELFLCINKKQ